MSTLQNKRAQQRVSTKSQPDTPTITTCRRATMRKVSNGIASEWQSLSAALYRKPTCARKTIPLNQNAHRYARHAPRSHGVEYARCSSRSPRAHTSNESLPTNRQHHNAQITLSLSRCELLAENASAQQHNNRLRCCARVSECVSAPLVVGTCCWAFSRRLACTSFGLLSRGGHSAGDNCSHSRVLLRFRWTICGKHTHRNTRRRTFRMHLSGISTHVFHIVTEM